MTASPAPAHRVTLLLLAPGEDPVAGADVEALLHLLASPPRSPSWREVTAHVQGDAALVLEVVRISAGNRADAGGPDGAAASADAGEAARHVVDQVRARLGLDAAFARWVVDARHVRVRALPSDT